MLDPRPSLPSSVLAVESAGRELRSGLRRLRLLVTAGALLCWAGCAAAPAPEVAAGERRGEEIAVCGRLFACGTRVVLWSDEGGYDGYQEAPFFPAELAGKAAIVGPRYGARRALPADPSLADVQREVEQFVLHYDVCGTSRQCFKILHDHRKLSVHFLLDVDGTIYQTLDLRERAWHATTANDRSVGVEIAHIGAYPHRNHRVLRTWYGADERGPFVRFPAWMKSTGLPPDFVGRPARQDVVHGVVQGRELWQFDYTGQQYAALARLTEALCRVLPRLRLAVPRAGDGTVRSTALPGDELAVWCGLLGHFHVQTNKVDPGPAFDWGRLLREAAAERAGRP
jgi:N-acetyl-anhydromuramyl-L-alanine amidase AmpD